MIEVYTKKGKQTFENDNDSEYKNALKYADRKNEPAVIEYNKNGNIEKEKWFLNGKQHRKYGPAYIQYYLNGNIYIEKYYINGILHRKNGPSFIIYFLNGNIECEEYYLNGKKHREDGPSIIEYHKNSNIRNEEYYLNDKKYSFKDWKKKLKIKDIKVQSQAELMKQMAKDKVSYNGQEYYISTTGNKPIVYTIKESKIFESFKESCKINK